MRSINEKFSFLLAAPIAVIYSLLLSVNWKPTWDSATYIMLGKSLITGHGFKYMGISHTKYPFMFPLMLSPIIGLFGRNFFLMRLLIVLMALGSVWLTFRLFRRAFDAWLGLGLMLITAASYPLMFECTRILSDIPYMFLSLLSLIFVLRYARDEKWSSRYGYITAGLLLVSFFTRYIGLALFAGTGVYLLLDSKGPLSLRFKKIALISVIFLIPASLWMARGAVMRKIDPPPLDLREFLSYEKELVVVTAADPHAKTLRLGDLTSRIQQNSRYYQDLTADIVSGKDANSKTRAWIIFVILMCGFIYSLVRWRTCFEYYVFFYILIYLAWTSLQGTRFLVPIIPFIFYYLIRALWLIPDSLNFLIKRLSRGELVWDRYWLWGKRLILAVLVVFLIYCNWSSDANIIRNEHKKPYYTDSTANFFDAVRWVKENTEPGAVVISGRSPWAYMLSERKTLTPPWVNNVEEVMASIRRNGADYVINSKALHSTRFISPVLQKNPDSFLKVYEKGDCVVYEVREIQVDQASD